MLNNNWGLLRGKLNTEKPKQKRHLQIWKNIWLHNICVHWGENKCSYWVSSVVRKWNMTINRYWEIRLKQLICRFIEEWWEHHGLLQVVMKRSWRIWEHHGQIKVAQKRSWWIFKIIKKNTHKNNLLVLGKDNHILWAGHVKRKTGRCVLKTGKLEWNRGRAMVTMVIGCPGFKNCKNLLIKITPTVSIASLKAKTLTNCLVINSKNKHFTNKTNRACSPNYGTMLVTGNSRTYTN